MTPRSLGHEIYMYQAIEIARQNPVAPFGCLLVNREIQQEVARGVNSSSDNPTFHGEIVAINDYVRQGGTNWSELTLYTTAESCCMCQGAILWAGLKEVVYAVSMTELKQMGWRQIDISAAEVVQRSWSPQVRVLEGILRDESIQLFEQVNRG